MMRATKFFRWVWRINALLILLIVAGVGLVIGSEAVSSTRFERRRDDSAVTPVAKQDPQKPPLVLSEFYEVEGASLLRARLLRTSGRAIGSIASNYESTTYNILYLDPATGAGRWLLPTHARTLKDETSVEPEPQKPIASAAIVTAEGAESGDLIVFDRTGTQIVQAAGNVSDIEAVAAPSAAGFSVVFKRGGNYHVAQFAMGPLRKTGEMELRIPLLN